MDLPGNHKEQDFCVYLEVGHSQMAAPIVQWLEDCADLSQVASPEQAHLHIWDWAAFEYHKQLGEVLPKDLLVLEPEYQATMEQSVLIHGAYFFTYPSEVDILLLRLSVLIQKLRYLHTLESLSVSDPLTGVFNRRKFDQELNIAWRQGKRQQSQCSLLLVDVDFFKRFNDNYGHLAGDQCLRELATIFKQSAVRPHDIVARIGGEEFAVILPDTPLNGAKYVAQQIIQAVSSRKILNEGTDLGYVTVSIGVSSALPCDAHKLSDWQQSADDALYAAKANGRNQFQWEATTAVSTEAEIF